MFLLGEITPNDFLPDRLVVGLEWMNPMMTYWPIFGIFYSSGMLSPNIYSFYVHFKVYRATTVRAMIVCDDDDNDDWYFTATFVHIVGRPRGQVGSVITTTW